MIGKSEMPMVTMDIEPKDKHKEVLFVDVPLHTDQELAYAQLKDAGQNMDLPRGMLSIASTLKGHEVSSEVVPLDAYLYPRIGEFISGETFDSDKFTAAIHEIVDRHVESADPKAVAVSMMYTFAEPTAIELTRYIKAKYPDKRVIVGGNHATFNDLDLLDTENKSGIDIVVRYEGEVTMTELMKELESPDPDLSKVLGISWKDERGNIHQNPPRERADLYQLPPLDYSLINSPEGMDKFNHTAMFVRGCRGNCAFCTSPAYWGRELTEGKVSNLRTELEYLAQNGVLLIGLLDDDILASEQGFELIIDTLKEVKAKYPHVSFIAQTRIVHLRENERAEALLGEMKEAGISKLYLGIESGSQDILNEMGKGYKVEWVEPALRNVKKAGIETGGFWLFGHPGATPEKEAESLQFLERLLSERLLDEIEAHGVVPIPGSRISTDPRVQVFDHDFKHYGFLNNFPVYNLVDPETGKVVMSAKEIKACLDRANEMSEKYVHNTA